MIIIDTHIWIWWVSDHSKLSEKQLNYLKECKSEGLGISIISCWEVAKLVEKNRLNLSVSVENWIKQALDISKIQLLDLTLPIVLKSTQLTGFHNDPADQIIVATAIICNYPLLTADHKILTYSEIQNLLLI